MTLLLRCDMPHVRNPDLQDTARRNETRYPAQVRSLCLDVVHLALEVLQVLLDRGVLLGHLLVLGLPLIALLLEGLDFPLEVAGLDVGLAKPGEGKGLASEHGIAR